MSDKTPSKSEAPGSSSADESPTTEVPRISTSDRDPAAEEKQSSLNAISEVLDGDKNADGQEHKGAGPTGRQAGNVADATKPAVQSPQGPGPNPSRNTGSVTRPNTAPNNAAKAPVTGAGSAAGVTPVPRPMTAGEYARTTNPSPSTTSVISPVRDEPRAASGAAAAAEAASGRQASLKLVRVDPWSVTKVTFALTVALMIVAVVAMFILWIVLSFAGVWDQINSSVTSVLSDDSNTFDITDYLGLGRIVGLTLVISAINVVITTAVATIGAYLYNLAAQLVGGVDVTLAEED
ncbi:DUF3566 domain-containing protein [Aeromicrobium sp.]